MNFGAIVNFILVPVNIFIAIYYNSSANYAAAGLCLFLGCICLTDT